MVFAFGVLLIGIRFVFQRKTHPLVWMALGLSLSFFEIAILPDVFALHALFITSIAYLYLFAPGHSRWRQKGATSLSCYEPLFGYRLEKMHFELVPGPTALVYGEAFHIHNPACLVYSDQLNCPRWSRIPEMDKSNFDKFTNGEHVDWEIPWGQQILLYLSGTIVLLLIFLTVGAYSLRLRRYLS